MVVTTEIPPISSKDLEVFCFGASAERYAGRLPQGLSAIICDGSNAALALAKAVELRRQAIPFLFFPLLENGPGMTASLLALEILTTQQHPDQQRVLFEALSQGNLRRMGDEVIDTRYHDPRIIGTLSDLMYVADGVIFRSQTERIYIEDLLFCRRSFATAIPFSDMHVPSASPKKTADRILVWGPYKSANELAIFAYALSDLKKPALFVCEGSLPNSKHEYIDLARSDHALEQAGVIVDTNFSDPGTALAFAERGFGIVAARTSGAHEYIRGLTTYKPDNFLDISGGVSRARTARRTFVHIPPNNLTDLHNVLEESHIPIPEELPLVSVVVPTYNRLTEIRNLCEAFSRQTYPRFEVIIVNDCGESVEGIVSNYPFVRYFTTSKNAGFGPAAELGFREARGVYLASLADDDLQYPTHISDCVAGIIASRLDVVHDNMICRIDSRDADDRLVTTGHTLTFRSDFDRTSALSLECITACPTYIATKAAMLTLLPLNERFPSSNDHIFWLELSKHYDFAHVDRVNIEFRVRNDGSSFTSQVDFSEDMAKERADVLEYYLPPGRPLIKERQAAVLEKIRRTGTLPNALLLLEPPLKIAE